MLSGLELVIWKTLPLLKVTLTAFMYISISNRPIKHIIECFNCETAWSDWSACDGGQRTKLQYIAVPQVGGGDPCPTLESQTEGEFKLLLPLFYLHIKIIITLTNI